MTINASFGIYNTPIKEKSISDLSMDFVFPLELVTQWKRCGMVADFLADYQSFVFKHRKKAISVLSTIINELLENAVKFSSDKNKLVNLSIRHYGKLIEIETINLCNKTQAERLNSYIAKLRSSNIEKLFYDQIEYTAKQNKSISGLGLLTLIKDYSAEIGIKIIPKIESEDSFYNIYVKIFLFIKEIEHL
jgi:hypothetical protein